MMEAESRYEQIEKEVNKTVRRNLEALMKVRGLSQRSLANVMAQNPASVSRTLISKIINGKAKIPLAYVVCICSFFGVTFENLVSKEFNANQYIRNDSDEHKEYCYIKSEISKLNAATALEKDMEVKACENVTDIYRDAFLPFSDKKVITDPTDIMFEGYLQKYYCYFYPTGSSVNKEDIQIVKGTLTLEAEKQYCKSTLVIRTGVRNKQGEESLKCYYGYAAYSPTVNSIHCVMFSEKICEFCFVMFRAFKINCQTLDCRIAEMLTSSSATEDRRPTVLRMLISREKIKDEDLKMASSSLLLNYSTITVSEEAMKRLAGYSNEYHKIIDQMQGEAAEPLLVYKERTIMDLAHKCLENEEKETEFLMQLRHTAHAYRNNKVSKKADTALRDFLISRGYYKKE